MFVCVRCVSVCIVFRIRQRAYYITIYYTQNVTIVVVAASFVPRARMLCTHETVRNLDPLSPSPKRFSVTPLTYSPSSDEKIDFCNFDNTTTRVIIIAVDRNYESKYKNENIVIAYHQDSRP